MRSWPLHPGNEWLTRVRTIFSLISMSFALVAATLAQTAPALPAQAPALVQSALDNEVRALLDTSHPMRYHMRKSSPRLTTTKELIETRDGSVATLLAVNDSPLTPSDDTKEQARLQALFDDPAKQRHRKQVEADDTARAIKALRALPTALLFTDAGAVATASGPAEKFTFVPNPKYNPPDLETQVLTALNGEILIEPSQARVIRLEGRLEQDVDFGWGILGRLSKGGWIIIDQAEVGGGLWRVAKFQMKMTGRLLIRTRTFDTTEEQSHYTPVATGLDYKQGIAILRNSRPGGLGGR